MVVAEIDFHVWEQIVIEECQIRLIWWMFDQLESTFIEDSHTDSRGRSRVPFKGVLMFKSVDVRFADFISLAGSTEPPVQDSSEPTESPLYPPLNS